MRNRKVLGEKTFYFQALGSKNDSEGKALYKLKSRDYPLSFNNNGYVYTFRSQGKIYRPYSDNSYYISKESDDKYKFEQGNKGQKISVVVDPNNESALIMVSLNYL